MSERAIDFYPQKLYPRFSRLAAVSARNRNTFRMFRKSMPISMDASSSKNEIFCESLRPQTSLAVIGFPRTGTTFLQYAIEQQSGKPGSVFKTHEPLSIRSIAGFQIPVLVPIRNPIDTCISWSYYNHDEPTQRMALHRLATYLAWHRILERKLALPGVHLVGFDSFTHDIGRLPKSVNSLMGLSEGSKVDLTHHLLENFTMKQQIDAQPLAFQNAPTTMRKDAAAKYRDVFLEVTDHRIARKSFELYSELSVHAL